MKKTEFVLGSSSTQKLKALEKVCVLLYHNEYDILTVKTSSGQNEQPVGFKETYDGALARAEGARQAHPGRIAVGIESGIFFVNDDIVLDIAIVVIISKNGHKIVSTSTGIQFPKKYVDEARVRGFDKTCVGNVIAEKMGGDHTDPHKILTGGEVTRSATLSEALLVALKQL